jgi:hypothetical protein
VRLLRLCGVSEIARAIVVAVRLPTSLRIPILSRDWKIDVVLGVHFGTTRISFAAECGSFPLSSSSDISFDPILSNSRPILRSFSRTGPPASGGDQAREVAQVSDGITHSSFIISGVGATCSVLPSLTVSSLTVEPVVVFVNSALDVILASVSDSTSLLVTELLVARVTCRMDKM